MAIDQTPTSTDLPPAVQRYVCRASPRFPDDEFQTRVRAAYDRGRRRARELTRKHSTTDPVVLSETEGVTVVSDEWAGMGSFTLLGGYANGTITIYERQVSKTAASLPVSRETVRNAVVAHELGHHVVEIPNASTADGSLERLRAVLETVRGARPRRARTVLAETAVHAFADRLVDVSPLSHPLEVTEQTANRNAAADRQEESCRSSEKNKRYTKEFNE